MSYSQNPSNTPCIIYCRVSSLKQLKQGDGLKGQEKRCRDYAAQKSYTVLDVFHEEAITGGIAERPAMRQMLEFLTAQSGETIVIVDDLKRFARDVESHFGLKVAIYRKGGRLESPSFRFGDTAEDRFIETVLAAQAELERNQNKRQVCNRMKARLEQGYWTFNPPAGYRYKAHPVHKKILIVDRSKAKYIRAALEGFASDHLRSISEVQRFLAAQGYFGAAPNPYSSKYTMQTRRMLGQVLYAGHLEFKAWQVSLRPAHHPALISLVTYQKIQQKLQEKRMTRLGATVRADRREDFPLRNFVLCQTCRYPLTGSWSRGRKALYAYYHCYYKGCDFYGKGIPKQSLESDFAALLQGLNMDEKSLLAIRVMAEDVWRHKTTQQEEIVQRSSRERNKQLQEIEENLKGLADKLARTSSDVVSKTLEERIEELDKQRLGLLENTVKMATSQMDFGTAFERVKDLLQNPHVIWNERDIEWKHLVQRLVFTAPLSYDRNSGFGTADLALPYLISRRMTGHHSSLVDIPLESWNQFFDQVFDWASHIEVVGRAHAA
jgi:DNA invertase Pin-like site-specific DNA recombinase